jgi:hypothetical protein
MSYSQIFKKLNEFGDFQVINNMFYLATELDRDKLREKIQWQRIKEINQNNYLHINSIFCREWCNQIFLKNQIKDYEEKHQDYLIKLNKDLDFLLTFESKEALVAYLTQQIGGGNANGDKRKTEGIDNEASCDNTGNGKQMEKTI